jgi:putative ABC transport system permease protein
MRDTAMRMIVHRKMRALMASLGIAVAFFLAAAQIGLMVGWCDTCSAIILHADADLWLVAEQTPAFDYGTSIAKRRLYQTRSVPGVKWAEAMVQTWGFWQLPDGRRQNVEIIGLDSELLGAPWRMKVGSVECVHDPDRIIIDSLFCESLGVHRIGEEVELTGRRAILGGISAGVRTLTASPFVFSSMRTALHYDPRYSIDDVTYILVQCESGESPATVRERIAASVPGVEALTSWEFAVRTMRYWLLGTGLGITVVLTAILGLAVGMVIISQTLFTITQENLSTYAMLMALGFSRLQLITCVFTQTAVLAGSGIVLGSLLFYAGCVASADTPIPLETTPAIYGGLVCLSLLSSLAASYLSVKTVLSVDPVSVFRA